MVQLIIFRSISLIFSSFFLQNKTIEIVHHSPIYISRLTQKQVNIFIILALDLENATPDSKEKSFFYFILRVISLVLLNILD